MPRQAIILTNVHMATVSIMNKGYIVAHVLPLIILQTNYNIIYSLCTQIAIL